jgi:hypothetical protein
MTIDEKDSFLRCLNEAAIAKHLLLSVPQDKNIKRHLDACLSWSYPLLGVEHPAINDEVARSSQCALLHHEDMNHQGLNT